MRIVCSDTGIFKSSFEAISKIVNEVQMEIDSKGVRVDAIDSSHVTFVHLDIDEYEFDVFDCDKPERIYFDSGEFLKYLKRVNKDSILELSIDGPYLIIHSEGVTTKKFKLKLLDVENPVPSLPEIEYQISIEMPTKLFKEICGDIVDFSQKLKIKNEGNIIKFESFGAFVDSEIEYIYQNDISESYSSVYDIYKIKDIMKADKFASNINISFGNDMPILFEMKNENEKQKLDFILAPRIEED